MIVRGVVEALPSLPDEVRIGIHARLLLVGVFDQDGLLGGLQDAVEATQNGERQNDLAVIRLFVVAPQQIGDRPDEGRQRLVIHGVHAPIMSRAILFEPGPTAMRKSGEPTRNVHPKRAYARP